MDKFVVEINKYLESVSYSWFWTRRGFRPFLKWFLFFRGYYIAAHCAIDGMGQEPGTQLYSDKDSILSWLTIFGFGGFIEGLVLGLDDGVPWTKTLANILPVKEGVIISLNETVLEKRKGKRLHTVLKKAALEYKSRVESGKIKNNYTQKIIIRVIPG